jgi:hypothetical protein
MAAPTPATKTFWDGTRGMTRWYAAWTDGTALTDTVVVDVSALNSAPASVKILSVDAVVNGDISITLEFDATSDELFDRFLGQSDASFQFIRDYTQGPNGGYVPDTAATGFAGDLLLTSANQANGDEVNLLIVFEKSS